MDDYIPDLQELYSRLLLQLYPDHAITERGAAAFTTTGDACVDFFGSVVRGTSVETVIQGFVLAWNENPEKALKLLLNLRDIRGGKGEKKLALILLYTLSCWKPLTYLANLQRFLKVGSYKDLLFLAEMDVRCDTITAFERIPQMNSETVELKVMACQLVNDETDLLANQNAGISLCAKWAPTENTHFDRKPLRFARKITHIMGIKRPDYRKRLTKLRAQLSLLEHLMCTDQHRHIEFARLPSKSHRLYRASFKRDYNRKGQHLGMRNTLAKRYEEYLSQLAKGKTTINSAGIQPHELIQPYLRNTAAKSDLTIEGQWKDIVQKLKQTGKFKNALAVCDVSDSMRGTPLDVAIALGLLVSELTDPPFRKKLITFSAEPEVHQVGGRTLKERVESVKGMKWGMNTDLIKVFQLILLHTKKAKDSKMIKKLFIFTDMQFDEATKGVNAWTTTYDFICKMYGKTEYAVPKVIFWNLRATDNSFPVTKNEAGTALVSGFSAQMLKSFMESDVTKFNPVSMMDTVLDRYEFTPIPVQEWSTMPTPEVESLGQIRRVVEDFLVPTKVPIPLTVRDARRRAGSHRVVWPVTRELCRQWCDYCHEPASLSEPTGICLGPAWKCYNCNRAVVTTSRPKAKK